MRLFEAIGRRRKATSHGQGRGARSALAEIGELTDSVRRTPSGERERRLVRLRHDAFAELDPAPPAPIPAPDRSALQWVDGLPAAPSGSLSASVLRAGILEGGCLLVRGLVEPDWIARMIAGIDRAFAARDANGDGEEAGWYEPLALGGGAYNLARQRQWVTSAGGLWTADSPRLTFELIELFRQIGLIDLIAEYLGEQPVASVNKWTLRRVSPGGDGDWHQDGAFLGERIRAVNVWLALTDCGRDAPGMDVVPRRIDRVLETGTSGARFEWSVSPSKVGELLDGAEPLRPEFRAGDLLLFDQLFLHQTATDPAMTRDRYAVETWCFGPTGYPDKQVPLVL